MKNVNAIDKIIKQLSLRDYKAKCAKLTPAQKRNISIGRNILSDYGGYTLSGETKEALSIKHDYLNDRISEAEYKSWCLKWNLRHK